MYKDQMGLTTWNNFKRVIELDLHASFWEDHSHCDPVNNKLIIDMIHKSHL